MASLCAAPRLLLVAVWCIIDVAQGFSLVQLKADTLMSSPSIEELSAEDGPPDTAEVMSVLENINSSLDKIDEVVTTANTTAYAMVDGFMQAIAGVQDSLATLSTAAAAASSMPGAEDVQTQVSKFISKANASLLKVQSKVPATLDKFSAKLAIIMPELTKVADKAFGQFVDALNIIVNDIYNNSATNQSMRSVERAAVGARNAHKHASKESVRESPHKADHARRHNSAEPVEAADEASKTHKHARKASATEAVALLRERVFQDLQGADASNVEGALFPKKHSTSPLQKATRLVKQANSTLDTLLDKFAKTNGTIAGLLDMALDAATTAIDDINATVAPSLAELPDSLTQVVSGPLDTLLTLKESMGSDVQTKLGELDGMIEAALESLAQALSLADELVAAIDEASNATAGADVGEGNATGTSTEAPDAAESTSAAPEAAESTTAASDAAESTSEAPEAAESTTAAPEAAESTTAAPEAADSTSAAPEAAASTTAAPAAAESTTAAPAESTSAAPDAAVNPTAAPTA